MCQASLLAIVPQHLATERFTQALMEGTSFAGLVVCDCAPPSAAAFTGSAGRRAAAVAYFAVSAPGWARASAQARTFDCAPVFQ